jgi:hypothetical protein
MASIRQRPAGPRIILRLCSSFTVYGYLNRVQSSRQLEREAARNLEVVWLTGQLVPDHKTIADFRKNNGAAVNRVCRGSSSCSATWACWQKPALPSTEASLRP